jgi:hypothetical protein
VSESMRTRAAMHARPSSAECRQTEYERRVPEAHKSAKLRRSRDAERRLIPGAREAAERHLEEDHLQDLGALADDDRAEVPPHDVEPVDGTVRSRKHAALRRTGRRRAARHGRRLVHRARRREHRPRQRERQERARRAGAPARPPAPPSEAARRRLRQRVEPRIGSRRAGCAEILPAVAAVTRVPRRSTAPPRPGPGA